MASIPSFILNKPVKLVLDRHQDTNWCPGRSPCTAKYSAAWSKENGKVSLDALEVNIELDGGFSLDYSMDILEAALFLLDSS